MKASHGTFQSNRRNIFNKELMRLRWMTKKEIKKHYSLTIVLKCLDLDGRQ